MARILIVEAESIVAEDIKRRLQDRGYTVSAVVSFGEEAIQKIEETKPDVVLMDIALRGDMKDLEKGEQIHTQFHIPVVYLTAYIDETVLQQAKITEPYRWLTKPLDDKKLYNSIEMAIKNKN